MNSVRSDRASAATTDALPVAPWLAASLLAARLPREAPLVDQRSVPIVAVAMPVGCTAAFDRAAADRADRAWSPSSPAPFPSGCR